MPVFLLLFCYGCAGITEHNKEATSQDIPDTDSVSCKDFLQREETLWVNKKYDNVGKLLEHITFALPDTAFEGGSRHWITLADPALTF
jgi:hypothetical protein